MVKINSTGSEAGREIRTLFSIFQNYKLSRRTWLIYITSVSGVQNFATLRNSMEPW